MLGKLVLPSTLDRPAASRTEPYRPSSEAASGMRILLIDIEVCPSIVATWKMYDGDIFPEAVLEPGRILCFSAKWLGEETIHFLSEYHNDPAEMVSVLHNLLEQADVVMHYYGKKFDVPKINTLFLKEGLPPPAPFRQIDLHTVISKKFAFEFNKLGYVSEQLSLPGKAAKIGISNWLGCMRHEPEPWNIMREYNMQDVQALEDLYYQVQAWVQTHPSHAAHAGEFICPRCGSNNLEKRGFAYTQVSKYQRYRCNNCGGWSRDSRSISTVKIREVADG